MSGPRIVVVGSDELARVETAELLRSADLSDVTTRSTLALSEGAPPDLIVVVGDQPEILIGEAREIPMLSCVPVLAIVPVIPDHAAASALAAGADDVVLASRSAPVLGARARSLIRGAVAVARARRLDHFQRAMLEINTLMADGGDEPYVLRQVLLLAVAALDCDRASIFAHLEASDRAYVIAATDDPSHSQFDVAISDYPELSQAVHLREPVLIDDAQNHKLTISVAEVLRRKGIVSIGVFPIVWRKRSLGALMFRSSKPGLGSLDADSLAFAHLISSQLAGQLRDGSVIERLRDKTRRISRASYEAERRLGTIDSLKEHFEASADGVVVLDEEGRILFVNGTAEAITGFARDGLLGTTLVDLVPSSQREPLNEVIFSVLHGHNLEAFDLDLSTTSGQPICVSVTTSTVLSKSGAVILSFRDVTAERSLEIELTHTKDFLEKLIDSAVDAIIAADMRGRVILFNPGAERLIGYSANEVIGKISVWNLYPAGVAGEVMTSLRAGEDGGVGMLKEHRREVLSKSGELVPVNMTASIIYEEGREVATVGIFTDLREQLSMEQRLVAAQEELEMRIRQAMVAQLAGAAAHELNQPLTSILGYAQLIQRLSEGDDAPHARAVAVIMSEAERMAEIVKKIGRITKYETKDYVGSASIMDLDKSASSSGEIALPQFLDKLSPGPAANQKDRAAEPPAVPDLTVHDDDDDDDDDDDHETPTTRVMRRASISEDP